MVITLGQRNWLHTDI